MRDKYRVIKIVTAATLIFIALLFIALLINLVKLGQETSREKSLIKELNALEARIAENQEEIVYKDSDEYIARYAREYLNMKGKGERVYIESK